MTLIPIIPPARHGGRALRDSSRLRLSRPADQPSAGSDNTESAPSYPGSAFAISRAHPGRLTARERPILAKLSKAIFALARCTWRLRARCLAAEMQPIIPFQRPTGLLDVTLRYRLAGSW